MNDLLLRRVRIIGDGRLVDVSVVSGKVAGVGPGLEVPAAGEVIDLDGRWLMPGLWDAHVHFTQWARHRGRIDLSGAVSAADAAATLRAHVGSRAPVVGHGLAAPAGPAAGAVVGRGFQDALWPDALDPGFLTGELIEAGGVPVIAISHDLHCVWLNAAAAALLGAPHAGVLREVDAFAAEIALDRVMGDAEALVDAAAAEAASRGVVGVRDLEFADNVESWSGRVARGLDTLRVEACTYPEHLAASDARGVVGGSVVVGTQGLVTVGALKLFTDGSLNTRTAHTHEPYGTAGGERGVGHAVHGDDELRALFAAAAERRLEVAAHAIGDAAVTRALDAFEATGAGGTVEHAQLVRALDLPRFARLGVAASVQPQHALDDRDVADVVWADRLERAFPYLSLHEAGARLMLGSDAPVAPLDPWGTIAAAVHHSDDGREPWQPQEQLSREVAVEASTRSGFAGEWIAAGDLGDLAVVDYDPLQSTPAALRAMTVALTVVGGRVTYSSS